ncbi:hypothetical protein C8R43DRAFT_949941 [Mycena crocata]|nr:hypothetical protein C8R43DRAFT_949941 [Mycena crocata]
MPSSSSRQCSCSPERGSPPVRIPRRKRTFYARSSSEPESPLLRKSARLRSVAQSPDCDSTHSDVGESDDGSFNFDSVDISPLSAAVKAFVDSEAAHSDGSEQASSDGNSMEEFIVSDGESCDDDQSKASITGPDADEISPVNSRSPSPPPVRAKNKLQTPNSSFNNQPGILCVDLSGVVPENVPVPPVRNEGGHASHFLLTMSVFPLHFLPPLVVGDYQSTFDAVRVSSGANRDSDVFQYVSLRETKFLQRQVQPGRRKQCMTFTGCVISMTELPGRRLGCRLWSVTLGPPPNSNSAARDLCALQEQYLRDIQDKDMLQPFVHRSQTGQYVVKWGERGAETASPAVVISLCWTRFTRRIPQFLRKPIAVGDDVVVNCYLRRVETTDGTGLKSIRYILAGFPYARLAPGRLREEATA